MEYKVIGEGVEETFEDHSKAFAFAESLEQRPKAVYRILSDNRLGELNTWFEPFSGDCYSILDNTPYKRVVI